MKHNQIASALEKLWYGTEASLHDHLNLQAQIEARVVSSPGPEEEDDKPYLLSIDQGIGTIKIAGPISNRTSWFDKFFQAATYPAIRDAVISAAENPEVKSILLDINSGGGAVNGVSDTAELIRLVNDNVKPVTAYTDGTMASAAYWLGSSAGAVYASNVAMVGSIGVITTHMEYSKAMKDEGIGVTVMRAGKYKALVNSVEPLTEEARAQVQGHLDAAYKIFVQHVAEARDQPYDYVDANMAQGREFLGEQALSAGLVDGIESFDALISRLQAESIDKSRGFFDNPRNLAQGTDPMKKKALTVNVLSALAAAGMSAEITAGAAAAASGLAAAPAAPSVPDPAAVAAAVAAAANPAAAAAPAAEPTAAAAEPTAPAAAAAAAEPSNQIVEFLQGQIKESSASLLAANIELSSLRTKVSDMDAAHQGLVDIAAKSISTMQIAMGGTALDATNMTAVAVLAEHKRVVEQFQSKFKAGGVAAVDAAEASKGNAAVVDPLQRARLAAVRPTAKSK